jgi:iron-sulfur cluster assembly accessory protein
LIPVLKFCLFLGINKDKTKMLPLFTKLRPSHLATTTITTKPLSSSLIHYNNRNITRYLSSTNHVFKTHFNYLDNKPSSNNILSLLLAQSNHIIIRNLSTTTPSINIIQSVETPTKPSVILTPRAQERITTLRRVKNDPSLLLRLTVESGGCSGFSYKFSMTSPPTAPDDVILNSMCVVDEISLGFVNGARIDFTEDLIRRSFEVVDNPNSETKCGCGASFAPKTG